MVAETDLLRWRGSVTSMKDEVRRVDLDQGVSAVTTQESSSYCHERMLTLTLQASGVRVCAMRRVRALQLMEGQHAMVTWHAAWYPSGVPCDQ